MNYVLWVFKQAQILTPMLTSLPNLSIIHFGRQQQRLQDSHKRRGCENQNHQWHLERKREEDVMKMKEEKEEAAVE